MPSQYTSKPSIALYDAAGYQSEGFLAPDVYFAPGYGRAEEAQGAGTWASVVAFDGRWQLPLHTVRLGHVLDAVSPYGYSGVFASSDLSSHDRDLAWKQAMRLLQEQGYVSLFLRQTALLPEPFGTAPGTTVVAAHPTVILPTGDADQAWAGMQGRSRTSIRKAERCGYVSNLRSARPDDLTHGSGFRMLYESAMERRQASARYYFTDSYYEELADSLGDSLLIGQTYSAAGELTCAALFMRHGDLLHYHLSGSNADSGRAGATNQLIWAAIQWAVVNGVSSLHLGGGVSPGDSLQKFKQSFGGALAAYSAYGVIIDEDRYSQAVADRASEIGRSVSDLLRSPFFPAYRVAV